jgi:hypothetical protein
MGVDMSPLAAPGGTALLGKDLWYVMVMNNPSI